MFAANFINIGSVVYTLELTTNIKDIKKWVQKTKKMFVTKVNLFFVQPLQYLDVYHNKINCGRITF